MSCTYRSRNVGRVPGLDSLRLGVGVAPKIVLDNSPHAARVRVLDIEPALAPYDLGPFTLQRHLKNPLLNAFWSLLVPSSSADNSVVQTIRPKQRSAARCATYQCL